MMDYRLLIGLSDWLLRRAVPRLSFGRTEVSARIIKRGIAHRTWSLPARRNLVEACGIRPPVGLLLLCAGAGCHKVGDKNKNQKAVHDDASERRSKNAPRAMRADT